MRVGRKRGIVTGVTLVALIALAVASFGSVAAAGSGGGTASIAKKKKCKKGFKLVKKHGKKKCKKKKNTNQAAAQPSPLVRATLTWTGGAGNTDFDLWVFDSNGNKARAASNPIPSSSFSPNSIGAAGSEAFTDLVYVNPGARNFSFGVCYQDGGSLHVIYKLDYVTADGVHHTDSQDFGSDGASATYNGGAPIPATFCKA